MSDLRRIASQEDSLAFGIRDVHRREFLTDCYFVAEGGERIKCHQCILACSPILKSILSSLEFRAGGNEAGLSIPDFHPESIRKLLRFLYEGEVSLQKGSRTLLEFKELCNLLEINPPVKKYRRLDESLEEEEKSIESKEEVIEEEEKSIESKEEVIEEEEKSIESKEEVIEEEEKSIESKEEVIEEEEKSIESKEEVDEEEDIPRIPCEFCSLTLPDRASYEAHVGYCELKATEDSFKMPDNFDLPEEEILRCSGGPPSYANTEGCEVEPSGSPALQVTSENTELKATTVSSTHKKQPSGDKKKKLIHDLFGDEPSVSSSCGATKKRVQSFKDVEPKSEVIDELAEKRRRTISRLKDSVPLIPSASSSSFAQSPIKRPPKIVHNPPKWTSSHGHSSSDSSNSEFQTVKKERRKPNKKRRSESFRIPSSSSSEDEDGGQKQQDSLLLSSSKRLPDPSRTNSKAVRVSVQATGKETFMEYATYKLRLLCGSDEETERSSSGESDSGFSRLRRIRKKGGTESESKWDKLKLKRLERSKSVNEIKSMIESKANMSLSSASSSSSLCLKRSISEAIHKKHEENKSTSSSSSYPFSFNYGLSTENKLLEDKTPSQALLALSKVSFKKKQQQTRHPPSSHQPDQSSGHTSSSSGGGLREPTPHQHHHTNPSK